MLEAKPAFKLTTLQANLVSFFIAAMAVAVLLVLVIGYRDTTFGVMALAGIAAIGLGIAVFMSPPFGVCVLIVSVFSNISAIFTDQGLPGINKPLIALVALALLANRLASREPFRPFKLTQWLMLAYGGVWLASTYVARDRAVALDQIVDLAKDFVILLCIVYVLGSRPKAWKLAVWLIILTTAILTGLGTYQTLTGNTTQTFFGLSKFIQAQIIKGAADAGRLSGPLDDPNYWGQTLAAVLPLALYRLLDEQKLRLKLGAGLAVLLIVSAILDTYSRGAFLAMTVSLLFIVLERRAKFSLVSLVAIIALVMAQFLPASFTQRLLTLSIFADENAAVQSEDSFRGRFSEMQTGVNIFVDHPILGVGVGNFETNYQDYAQFIGIEQRTEDRRAHSLYLETAAETGLLGLLAFVGIVVSLMVDLAQARRKLKPLKDYPHWAAWIASLQAALIAYLTSSIFLHGDYLRYFWLLVALSIAVTYLADDLLEKTQAQLALELGNS